MTSLRIYDLKDHALALDLKELLRLLAPLSLQAIWTVSAVRSSRPGHAWFEATGESGERLEALAQGNVRLPGTDLAALAETTKQVIWGEFTGSIPTRPDRAWVIHPGGRQHVLRGRYGR